MALRARDGTDARLDDDERVGRVGESVMLGDDAELQLEPDGHPGLSCSGEPRGPRVAGDGRTRSDRAFGVASAAVGRL